MRCAAAPRRLLVGVLEYVDESYPQVVPVRNAWVQLIGAASYGNQCSNMKSALSKVIFTVL
jgi:hypothetical protein